MVKGTCIDKTDGLCYGTHNVIHFQTAVTLRSMRRPHKICQRDCCRNYPHTTLQYENFQLQFYSLFYF